MLTIYSVPIAVYSAKLRILLRHKNIPFEQLPPPGGYGSDAYRAIVPSGNIPAMIHDGFMLSDSEAIAEYLEEAFPATPMLPDTPKLRAKAREFSRSHDTRLEPAVRAMYPQVAYETRDTDAVNAGGAAISKQLASLALLLSARLRHDFHWRRSWGLGNIETRRSSQRQDGHDFGTVGRWRLFECRVRPLQGLDSGCKGGSRMSGGLRRVWHWG